jgi:hypothetical protein
LNRRCEDLVRQRAWIPKPLHAKQPVRPIDRWLSTKLSGANSLLETANGDERLRFRDISHTFSRVPPCFLCFQRISGFISSPRDGCFTCHSLRRSDMAWMSRHDNVAMIWWRGVRWAFLVRRSRRNLPLSKRPSPISFIIVVPAPCLAASEREVMLLLSHSHVH